MQGIDALGGFLDFAADDFRNQLSGELSQGAGGGFTLDDLRHLLANGANLRRAGVGGLLDLIGATLREGDREQAEEVVVRRLHGHVGFDERLPLANQRTQFIRREVQPMEIGQAILALDLVDTKLHLAESVVLIVLQVGK